MKETLTCLIPAGGEGTRLRPHTLLQPKPLLLMGNPRGLLMDFALQLSTCGDHTWVTTSCCTEKAEVVENYVLRHPNVKILRDRRKIGAGSLIDHYSTFSQEDPNGDLIVFPSDLVCEGLPVPAFLAYHKNMGVDITLLVVSQKNYGEYIMAEDGFAQQTLSYPVPGSLSTTGIYIFKNKYILDWILRELKMGWAGEERGMYSDIICPAVEGNKVAIFNLPDGGYWDDAGTLGRYHSNNMRFSDGQNVISDQARIDPGVIIERSVILGSPIVEGQAKFRNVILSGLGKDIRITQLSNEKN